MLMAPRAQQTANPALLGVIALWVVSHSPPPHFHKIERAQHVPRVHFALLAPQLLNFVPKASIVQLEATFLFLAKLATIAAKRGKPRRPVLVKLVGGVPTRLSLLELLSCRTVLDSVRV